MSTAILDTVPLWYYNGCMTNTQNVVSAAQILRWVATEAIVDLTYDPNSKIAGEGLYAAYEATDDLISALRG